MISNVEINKSVDFEVIWADSFGQAQDMNNVTFELYHYLPPSSAELVSVNKEPYIISEAVSDTLGVTTLNTSGTGSILTTSFITLELNIIVDQLEALGCPPNDFVVPNTNNKVSIVGGRKVFALSSCELAALINLQASGYFAECRSGFLVLKTNTVGSQTQIILDYGTLNPILGLSEGTTTQGTDLFVAQDIAPSPMDRVSAGKYVYSNLKFSDTLFSPDKRYYVNYKAIDPNTFIEQNKEEDFILVKPYKYQLNFSFTR